MPVLLVQYKLRAPGHDYTPLFEAIKNNANGWMRYFDDSWIVNTNSDDARAFAEKLNPFIVGGDFLFVSRLAGNSYGWLPKEGWDWLQERQY